MEKDTDRADEVRLSTPTGLFSEDELAALDWFRRRYWAGVSAKEVPDKAISYMLLRVALGHPKQLAVWIDEMIRYRAAEGVRVSELINRKIAADRTYQSEA